MSSTTVTRAWDDHTSDLRFDAVHHYLDHLPSDSAFQHGGLSMLLGASSKQAQDSGPDP